MHKIFFLITFLGCIKAGTCQDHTALCRQIALIDSVVERVNSKGCIQKDIVGQSPQILRKYEGTVFLDSSSKRIEKVVLTFDLSGDDITIYCLNDSLIKIVATEDLYQVNNVYYSKEAKIKTYTKSTEYEAILRNIKLAFSAHVED